MGCDECDKTGCVVAWLSLVATQRSIVTVHPRNLGSSLHARLEDAADFDLGGWSNELLQDTQLQSASAELLQPLVPAVDGRADRVLANRVQTFRSTTWHIRYRTAFNGSTVYAGGSPAVVSSASDWAPLRSRRFAIRLAAFLWLGCAIAGVATYRMQHEWFESHGQTLPLLACGIATAVALSVALGQLTRVPAARTKGVGEAGVATAAISAIAMLGLILTSRPTSASVLAEISRGEIVEAKLTLDALERTSDTADVPALRDALRVARIRHAPSYAAAIAIYREQWASPAAKDEAAKLILPLLEDEADRALAREDVSRLSSLSTDAAGTSAAERVAVKRALAECSVAVSQQRFGDLPARLDAASKLGAPTADVDRIRARAINASDAVLQSAWAAAKRHSGRRAALASALSAANAFTALSGKPSSPTLQAIRAKLNERATAKATNEPAGSVEEPEPRGAASSTGTSPEVLDPYK